MALKVTPEVLNLGKLTPGIVHDFSFDITNDGDSDVKVDSWASCGCTRPKVENGGVIPANSTVKLLASFDTMGKTGMQEKNLGINYQEEGRNKSISVKFTAKI